jgi:hypothetical protein
VDSTELSLDESKVIALAELGVVARFAIATTKLAPA